MLINLTDHEGTWGFCPPFDDGPGKYRQHIEKERKSVRVIQNITVDQIPITPHWKYSSIICAFHYSKHT